MQSDLRVVFLDPFRTTSILTPRQFLAEIAAPS